MSAGHQAWHLTCEKCHSGCAHSFLYQVVWLRPKGKLVFLMSLIFLRGQNVLSMNFSFCCTVVYFQTERSCKHRSVCLVCCIQFPRPSVRGRGALSQNARARRANHGRGRKSTAEQSRDDIELSQFVLSRVA